jgi:creatinine amidohydrolase
MATPDSVWLQDQSWQDVETYLDETAHPTVLVPLGSTEQHGPHLPLGVDAYQAIDVAEGIGERTDALVAPPIWYGDADHHLAFPGTVSLSSETVVAVLTDVYESLLSHGVENVVTVNGHRLANLPAMDIAARRTSDDWPEAVLAGIDLVKIGVRIHDDLREGDPEDGMHGGEFETSFMLFNHPELVDEDAFVPETHEGWTRFTSADFVDLDDSVSLASSRHDWDEDDLGHHGDPTQASAQKGEALFEAIVANGVEFVEDLHAHREGGGSAGLTY